MAKNYKDLNIKKEYRTYLDDIVGDFYLPVLSVTKRYDRAVGFFSSSSLKDIAMGVKALALNGGNIRIISSPKLSDEDIEAIKYGYECREEIIQKRILDEIIDPINNYEKEQLNLLANLIADGILDFKIVVTDNGNEVGMYHEKLGLLYDFDDNKISFSGSMNETYTGYNINYESIDVYTAWSSEDSRERIDMKEAAFKRIWEGKEKGIKFIEVTEVKSTLIDKFKYEDIDYNQLSIGGEYERVPNDIETTNEQRLENLPKIPSYIELREYQNDAIEAWKENKYRGIFVMATGTGKTYTGLSACVELFNHTNGRLALFIVCPQQHLVDQWVEDLRAFNINPIIGHSASIQKNFKERLHNAVLDYRLSVSDFFCFICTNQTFADDNIQKEIRKIKDNTCLMVDEAHNFGAAKISKTLEFDYTYRLALSATFERNNDSEGTQLLADFFGDKCINYGLEEAINNGMLTRYYYHPIVVYLTDGELKEYKRLTKLISKSLQKKNGKTVLSKSGEMYAQERARVVAGAKEKIDALCEVIEPYINKTHILVYCGATKMFDDDIGAMSEERQIDVVSRILGKKMKMKASQFTSNEDAPTRKVILSAFEEGEDLQALVAIKCLDEGVNIPSIRTAFILASTTNPKEYIQRRGRVLRNFPGKDYAEIYDFITLPRPIEDVIYTDNEELQGDLALIKNEIKRMEEFKKTANNPIESDNIISRLMDDYNLVEIAEENGNERSNN